MGILGSFKLDGRAALVTGAGQGIGRGYALALAEAGAHVAVLDINATTAETTATEIQESGKRALHFAGDATDVDDISSVIREIVSEWGRLDIGVNNVGGGGWVDAVDYTEETWDEAMSLNL